MSVIRQLRTRIWGRQLFGFPPPPAGHMAAVVSLFPRGLTELEAISVVGYLRGMGQAPSDSDIAEALMKFTHQLPLPADVARIAALMAPHSVDRICV